MVLRELCTPDAEAMQKNFPKFEFLSLSLTAISIYQLILVSQQMFYQVEMDQLEAQLNEPMTLEYQRFNTWMLVEICYVPAIMLVTMLYLFLRSFFNQGLKIFMRTLLLTCDDDFIMCQTQTIRFSTNTLGPAITTFVVLWFTHTPPQVLQKVFYWQLT
jgi:hypothetical protein